MKMQHSSCDAAAALLIDKSVTQIDPDERAEQ